MSYLPELRESLVEAAQRQAERPAPLSEQPRRRRPFGAVLLLGTSLSALVVAGVVLVLVGHRPSSSASSHYGSRSAALAAAQQLLAGFRPPAGAVAVPNARIGAPGGHPGAVDLPRFFVVRGGVESVMNKLADARNSLTPGLARAAEHGFLSGTYTESASASSSSSGSSSTSVVDSATSTIPLSPVGALGRELDIQVVRLGGDTAAIRVDAQAWWLLLRPIDERIPTRVDAVSVQLLGRLTSAQMRRHTQLTGADAAEVVSQINAWPLVQPDSEPATCRSLQASDLRIRLTFLGSGEHPDPVAMFVTTCGKVELWLHGRIQPPLAFGPPSSFTQRGLLSWLRFMNLLVGLPRPKSLPSSWQRALSELQTGSSGTGSTSAGHGSAAARR